MMAAVSEQPQTQLPDLTGEQIVNDAALERQLLERKRKKDALAGYREAFKSTDEAVKARIKELGISGTVRCGGFLITVKETAGRSVTFETEPSVRITIADAKE